MRPNFFNPFYVQIFVMSNYDMMENLDMKRAFYDFRVVVCQGTQQTGTQP